jgi:hypothetical protein
MKVTIAEDCAYCDPKNPSALARSFSKGQEIEVPEHIGMQMLDNGDAEDPDSEPSALETKVETPTETQGNNPFAPKAEPEETLETLRAKAEDLGVEVDNRWKEKRLREEIEAASAE